MMMTSTNLMTGETGEIDDEIDGEDTQELSLTEIELAAGCYGDGPRGLVSSANGRSIVRTGSVSGEIGGCAAPRRTLPGW